MLARLVPKVPEQGGWLYEMKYDGYRILAYIEGNCVKLMTRNGLDYTSRFQTIANSLTEWAAGRTLVLDGEVVILDAAGKTNFQDLQNYLQDPKGKNLVYIVFDLLALNGKDLRNQPLRARKARLESLLADAPEDIHYSAHVSSQVSAEGEELFQSACQEHLEGLIGKKSGFPIQRSQKWRLDQDQMQKPAGICDRWLYVIQQENRVASVRFY